jgi:hypothetical protein
MTAPVVVGFVLALIIAVVAFVCWWSTDTDLRDLKGHVADLMVWRADNFGPQPLAVVYPPVSVDTEPMPAVDVAGGLRTQVAAAREANRPKPTPFPRKQGRHAA